MLFPLGGQAEADHDESEADTHVEQGVEVAPDAVHDRNLAAGDVEDHQVGQTNDETGHHGGGQPVGGADPGDLALTLTRWWRESCLFATLGLWHVHSLT